MCIVSFGANPTQKPRPDTAGVSGLGFGVGFVGCGSAVLPDPLTTTTVPHAATLTTTLLAADKTGTERCRHFYLLKLVTHVRRRSSNTSEVIGQKLGEPASALATPCQP